MPTIAMIREHAKAERRVALTPETCKKLIAKNMQIVIEAGAGLPAGFTDEDYVGAQIASGSTEALAKADVLLCVQAPNAKSLEQLKQQAIVIGSLAPHMTADLMPIYFGRSVIH